MIVAFYLYLANVIKNVDVFLWVVCITWLVFLAIASFIYALENDRWHGKNWLVITPLCLLLFTALLPSERTMWLMAGAVVGEKAMESPVGKQAMEVIELKLSQEIDKLKGKDK
jgi:apolipoprotein N-acyltransferase